MSAPTITAPRGSRSVSEADRHGTGPGNLTDLVTRAQRGDQDAFGDIYRRFVQPIYRFVAGKVTNRSDAEDITADVFCKALAGIGRLNYPHNSLAAWLYTIASNCVMDHHRSNRVRMRHTYAEVPALEADPADVYDTYLTHAALHTAIRALPQPQDDVMTLRYLTGLTTAETATALNLTVPAVRAHQHRALVALRRSGFLSDLPGVSGVSADGVGARSRRCAA